MGTGAKRMLEDIAILTGGEVIAEEMGLKLANAQISQRVAPGGDFQEADATMVGRRPRAARSCVQR